ncbi:helix-turn-helix domain-containing protein [Dyella aluminiiresistens]|uniref:helix-turn-helix domain-containing protein n=1 Tax=Dyella aluminiiresistens TaxID=3069105 RepID=UPI00399C5760
MPRDFDQVRHQLARNIRNLRRSKRLSQEQLALNADVDRTYVSQIERAIGNPSLLVLCKLGLVLNVDIGALLDADKKARPVKSAGS